MTRMTRELRIGVVGAGFAGMQHAHCLLFVPGVQLAGVADTSAERRADAARQLAAATAASLEELLARERPDAVVVATPEGGHVEPCLEAVAAGRHVLVEKPLATSAEAGERVVRAAEWAGVILAVGHSLRFHPDYRHIRTAARDGGLGRLSLLQASRHRTVDVHDRLGDRVSLAMYLGVHEFDLVRWISGSEVVSVQAAVGRGVLAARGRSVYDHFAALLGLSCGATASVQESWVFPRGGPSLSSLLVLGDRGAAWLPDLRPSLVWVDDVATRTVQRVQGYVLDGVPAGAYYHQACAFARAIRTGDMGDLATGTDGLCAVRVAEAVDRAAGDAGAVEAART